MEEQLQELTVCEKIIAMEILWKELSKNQSDISSPEWHKEVLELREGKENYIDWSVAKLKIRDSI